MDRTIRAIDRLCQQLHFLEGDGLSYEDNRRIQDLLRAHQANLRKNMGAVNFPAQAVNEEIQANAHQMEDLYSEIEATLASIRKLVNHEDTNVVIRAICQRVPEKVTKLQHCWGNLQVLCETNQTLSRLLDLLK